MNPEEVVYPGGFRPGDEVIVVEGVFSKMEGVVVGPAEARVLREKSGCPPCLNDFEPDRIWVRFDIFGRPVPVLFEPCQIARR